MLKKILLGAAVSLAAGGTIWGSAAAAHAATGDSTTVTQSFTQRADSGLAGNWALDSVTLKAVVTDQGVVGGKESFAVTETAFGTFKTIAGAKTPGQLVANATISNVVTGKLTGTYAITLTAPEGTTLAAARTLAAKDLHGNAATGLDSTTDFPVNAFAAADQASVTPVGEAFSFTYVTQAGEKWIDASTGSVGDITGILPVKVPAPYVYKGHVITVNNNRAEVGWSESAVGWPNATSKCEQVYITGPGFAPLGDFKDAHIGFTCDHNPVTNTNVGYLKGLEAGHTYALRIVPATGTYGPGNNHPIQGAHWAYVDVVTTH